MNQKQREIFKKGLKEIKDIESGKIKALRGKEIYNFLEEECKKPLVSLKVGEYIPDKIIGTNNRGWTIRLDEETYLDVEKAESAEIISRLIRIENNQKKYANFNLTDLELNYILDLFSQGRKIRNQALEGKLYQKFGRLIR